jgi:hypothetical protein
MLILRINNELFFASDIVNDQTIALANERGISDHEFDEALLQFIFHLESCTEAIELFENLNVCPVCGAIASKGLMVHRDHADLIQ